jgi:hypothetical protein
MRTRVKEPMATKGTERGKRGEEDDGTYTNDLCAIGELFESNERVGMPRN